LKLNLNETIMKKTAKITTLAMALFAGIGGTAFGNGTEMPPPERAPEPVMQQPAEMAPAPVAKPTSSAGPYISADGGVALSGKDYAKTGYVVHGAVGYNFDPARVEVAVGYQRNDLKNIGGYISYWTFMANGYYDFDAGYGMKPYLMGGLGAADGKFSPTNYDKTDFAWQIGAGVGVKVADNVTFDLGYRYFKPDNNVADFDSHNIIAGLRYQF